DEDLRVWHMVGAVIYGLLLAMFVYADLSVGANNFSSVFPEGEIPEALRGLVLPLLAASAGTAIALGIVLADVLERTHFAPWHAGREVRIGLFLYCALLALTTVVLAILFGLTRLKGVEGLDLSPSLVAWIDWYAAISQVAIIAPMLLTTVLLWWGAAALAVAY